MSKNFSFGLLLLTSLISISSEAFLLIGSGNPPRYPTNEVIIRINKDTCTNSGITNTELKTLVQGAIDRFWSRVATTSLEFKIGSDIDLGGANPTRTTISTSGEDNVVISCTTDGFSSTSILAESGISKQSGVVRGYMYLNDMVGSSFEAQGSGGREETIAHELGHTIGIAHSEKAYALMYFSTGSNYKELSEDDADAVTYLYPQDREIGGLMGGCASISLLNNDDDDQGGGAGNMAFLFNLILGFLIALGLIKFNSRRNLLRQNTAAL